MKSVQAAKARSSSFAYLPSSSPKSQLTGAPSNGNASGCWLQNLKSSKASGDTNSEQDICIPAIYVKVVTLDLNLLIQTNKLFSSHLNDGIFSRSGRGLVVFQSLRRDGADDTSVGDSFWPVVVSESVSDAGGGGGYFWQHWGVDGGRFTFLIHVHLESLLK